MIKEDLIAKIDEIFGFNLSKEYITTSDVDNRSVDGVDYNFGQYKLNQLYRPLVRYFVNEFSSFLEGIDSNDSKTIIDLFLDFFRHYYYQGDFGYFQSKYSSVNYRIPYGVDYSGKDTEFWWASKDCYYVKTSDVVNDMDVKVPDPETLGERDIRLQFFKDKKLNDNGESTGVDVKVDEVRDEDEELTGYNITIYNWDEEKNREANKKIINTKLDEIGIQRFPGLNNMLDDFLKKWGRDYFIHKRLKSFLTGELEWYMYQVIKFDTQGKIDILSVQKQIEEIKAKHEGDDEYIEYAIGKIYAKETKELNPSVYQKAYAWIINFINILSDLEEFKAKLWNKKRKIIKQEYCISLGKIKEFESTIPVRKDLFNEILNNQDQLNAWKNEFETENYFGRLTLDIIKSELSSGDINQSRNMVVDTNYFSKDSNVYLKLKEWGEKKLYEEGEMLDGIMMKSENYQGLKVLYDSYKEKIQGTYIDPPFNLGENGDFLYKTDYLDGSRCSMLRDRYEEALKLMNNESSIFTRCDYNGDVLVKGVLGEIMGKQYFVNEIYVNRTSRLKNEGKKYFTSLDSLFLYSKSSNYYFEQQKMEEEFPIAMKLKSDKDANAVGKILDENFDDIAYQKKGGKLQVKNLTWVEMHASSKTLENDPIELFGKLYYPPKKRRRMWKNPDTLKNMEENGWIRINPNNGLPELLRTWKFLGTDWTDIPGYAQTSGFPTENAEELLKRCIETVTTKNDIFLDYFAGSATTQAAAHKLGRKRIGIELGEQFEDFDLPRLKSVIEGKKTGISEDKNIDYEGGGFFTYLYLNQYEDWFSVNGYLSTLEDDIIELTNLQDLSKISHILMPLNDLKERIYNLDDELSNEDLLSMSRMVNR